MCAFDPGTLLTVGQGGEDSGTAADVFRVVPSFPRSGLLRWWAFRGTGPLDGWITFARVCEKRVVKGDFGGRVCTHQRSESPDVAKSRMSNPAWQPSWQWAHG